MAVDKFMRMYLYVLTICELVACVCVCVESSENVARDFNLYFINHFLIFFFGNLDIITFVFSKIYIFVFSCLNYLCFY